MWNFEWKIKIYVVKIIPFIDVNITFVIILMITEKCLFVSSVLN
jgi:hypothetical protein